MRLAFGLVLVSVLLSTACGGIVARKYEYEEEIFLALDGSASVYVNASVPALVALRSMNLPLDPAARLDRQVVRDRELVMRSHFALLSKRVRLSRGNRDVTPLLI